MNRYLQYGKVLRQIVVEKGNFKTVLFREFKDDKQLKEAYGILIKAVKHFEKIKEIASILNQKKRNVVGNIDLFCILVVEQFFSQKKKIIGGGGLKKVVLENKEFIEKQLNINPNQEQSFIRQDVHIRWIEQSGKSLKDNTSKPQEKEKNKEKTKMTIESEEVNPMLQSLKDSHGFLKKATADPIISGLFKLTYYDYQEAIKKDKSLMESTEFVIQSKSSAMPAFILFDDIINKENTATDKFDVIDCCSAPGNKTMQSGEYIAGRGKVHAFEKNNARFDVLQERVTKYGFGSKIDCHNEDFLEVDTSKYPNVKYVVADPSCSGTGMLNHIYFDEDEILLEKDTVNNSLSFQQRSMKMFDMADMKMKARIVTLAEFQLKILNKIATFPNIRAFSYSTCSIHEQENEHVVAQFLNANKDFELIYACPKWPTRGFSTPHLIEGQKCVRVNPFEKESDGFFVALLQKKTE